jgi:putative transposase
MPWKTTCALEERLKFVAACLEEDACIAEICRAFAISRKSGYKYLARFAVEGAAALNERSRAPLEHPNATEAAIVAKLLATRRKHSTWGPRKLLAYLHRREPSLAWPAASTVGEIIKRAGLVVPRARRRRATPSQAPLAHAGRPNAVWCTDFKGWFRTLDGARCDPLTLTDAFSRYLLECRAVRKPDTAYCRPVFERAFREYGLPDAIRSDNGPPFASTGLGGLSRLNVWWIRLGVHIEHIKPASPQENGRHERMHLTLKIDTARKPKGSLPAQQKAFNGFREEYNTERPHEALGNQTPSELYTPSTREYPTHLPELVYPTHFETRVVRQRGEVKLASDEFYLSETLAGEQVGLERIDDEQWRVHFGPYALGVLNTRTRKLLSYRKLLLALDVERQETIAAEPEL